MAMQVGVAPVGSRVTAVFRVRGVRFWLLGGGFGLLYQIPTLINVWTSPENLALRIYGTVLLAVVYLAFLVLPPILWSAPRFARWSAVAAYAALTLALFPVLHEQIVWIWILVVAVAAAVFESAWEFIPLLVAVLLAMQVVIVVAHGEPFLYISMLVTASLGIVMQIMNRQLITLRSLREANAEIARLAVVEERARFSRDLHDVLGHSLTVVAVKSELAAKLVERDPAGALNELADIERLSRNALTDLRAAVSNYREASLETELVAARRALAAAGIHATLPERTPDIPAQAASFFAWVIREGVTNVVRHSNARHCVIKVDSRHISITDDGTIGGGSSTSGTAKDGGNGLRGLRERAETVGATVSAGPIDAGGATGSEMGDGFRLEATMPDE
ncbi:MAG: two-component sensor histidine kinase [Cryobacterium sp.]|nr:two-component sensor histidine kinase [Cryobacterium sp.]